MDQATLTGWAVIGEFGTVESSGTVSLADKKRTGESRGMRYVRLRKFLEETLTQWGIGLIVHEQTLMRGGAATEIANGLKGVILMVAADRGVDVTCVHTTELKKFATGNGKADKGEMIKAAEAALGRSVSDDNEADAVLIGLWAFAQYGGL